ncbi:MAG: hypothetical protein ACLTKQ_08605 [Acutalibacteraceae bacterium]
MAGGDPPSTISISQQIEKITSTNKGESYEKKTTRIFAEEIYRAEATLLSLTVRSGSTVSALDFGQDDEYVACVVDGEHCRP